MFWSFSDATTQEEELQIRNRSTQQGNGAAESKQAEWMNTGHVSTVSNNDRYSGALEDLKIAETWAFPVWWVDPGWMPGAHQSCSITPPPQLDGGRKKYNKRFMGWDKDREITQQLTFTGKTDSAWGN